MFSFWNFYILRLLRLEITFSDDTLTDINVVLCYVFSQSPSYVSQGFHAPP
jgi:hypothetical protein